MRDLFEQQYVLDVTNYNCPREIVDEVKSMWRDYELGNDHSYIYVDIDEYDENSNSPIYKALKEKGIKGCLVHYWW